MIRERSFLAGTYATGRDKSLMAAVAIAHRDFEDATKNRVEVGQDEREAFWKRRITPEYLLAHGTGKTHSRTFCPEPWEKTTERRLDVAVIGKLFRFYALYDGYFENTTYIVEIFDRCDSGGTKTLQ